MATLPFPPDNDALVIDGSKKLFMTATWLDWLVQLIAQFSQTARRVVAVGLASQAAAIGATGLLAAGTLQATIFRVSIATRVTQQATTSSSLTVTINTVIDGIACQISTPALVSNNRTRPETSTFLLRADSPLLLTYSTAYASVGATPMAYSIDVVVEAVQ